MINPQPPFDHQTPPNPGVSTMPVLPRLPISDQTWSAKYRFTGRSGYANQSSKPGSTDFAPGDKSITQTWERIAKSLAAVEKEPSKWYDKFLWALEDFKFLPAGRIIAGAGTGRKVTLHNCFVMDTIGDSVVDIFRNLSEAAITMQAGGGIGYDFSTIRPKGAPVRGVDADASGPLSYMEVWDAMCRTIMSAGSRRGAMMATLRCDHPDIEAFVTAKRTPGRLTMFNLSVLVTDDLMHAVEADWDWELKFAGQIYKTIPARQLWALIMQTTYDVAEPGVIFIDQINQRNNLYYCETISATNPCVVGSTRVRTRLGLEAIETLVDSKIEIWNGYEWSEVEPRETGRNQPIVTVKFSNGAEIKCTPYHTFILKNGYRDEIRNINIGAELEYFRYPELNQETPLLIVDIIDEGEIADTVYCFNEPKNHSALFNDVLTGNCGEQPLPPYGTCLLGSINLAAIVAEPFSTSSHLDQDLLKNTISVAVRMMDNVVEASQYPVERQRQEAESKRRIGLGVTGLADALAMCGLTYGSAEAVKTTRDWMRAFQAYAYEASVELAAEKGPFPLFDRDQYVAGQTIQGLPHYLVKAIGKHGIRNALVTSIAPTGTISLLADNISSGIEPIFAREYKRKVLQPDGSHQTEAITDYAIRLFQHLRPGDPIPPQFVTAQDLKVSEHLAMQAAVQDYIDSSISKTINVPEDYPFEDFQQIYFQAYKAGCKGCTTYRPSPARGNVLEVTGGKTSPAEPPKPATIQPRPEELQGVTSKLTWNDDPSLFLTFNVHEGAPFEIFINSKSTVHTQWTTAVSRLITAIFRRGGDLSFLPAELIQVTDPNGGAWIKGKYVTSLVALLGHKLQEHLVNMGAIAHDSVRPIEPESKSTPKSAEPKPGEVCPKCSAPTLIRREGCKSCQSCGYSSCG